MKIFLLCSFFLLFCPPSFAQTGTLSGRVFDSYTNEPVPFASVFIDSLLAGTVSDVDGNYRIENVVPGTYNIVCSYLGYNTTIFYEVRIGRRPVQIDFPMEKKKSEIGEVSVVASPYVRKDESPLSLRTISASEIYRNPGGNRDISKVIQILPGVASTLSFRNDIIVRGGAPNENRFYLDGIEVPNINHFATQGSSGGPVGMINVNFIREVDFYAGAFPANRGNALSSIIEFRQIKGNSERLSGTVMAGSSDAGLTLEGPIGNSSFIFSARRSYLQLLFKALSLPFLPSYNDFQYKHDFSINSKNSITVTGIGAIDDFELNASVNDGLTDSAEIKRNNFILGNLPVNTQKNYALGAKWIRFSGSGYQTLVVSRNFLRNKAIKFRNNISDPALLLLDYNSSEAENKIRVENNMKKDRWKLNSGAGYELAEYTNRTFQKRELNNEVVIIDYQTDLSFNKYALFTQLTGEIKKKLILSAGIRFDFNDYSESMNNPLEQFSPRLSASYALSEKLSLNFNAGRYFQLPPYTLLGYRDSLNNLANKLNEVTYIRSDHLIAGFEYNPRPYAKVTVEGFYKHYSNYPFLTGDSISLANLGGDFGVIGNDAATSDSKGRAYGVELLLQQKLSTSVYGILSYTWVRSEFTDRNNRFVPSSWDNRHILNITAGKKFARNWECGIKFRFLGGAPYTPYDVLLSSRKEIWDVAGQGIPDWSRLNSERNPTVHALDVRIDKKWFFKKWSLNAYLDIQNIYNYRAQAQPFIDVVRNSFGQPVEDPSDSSKYLTDEIKNESGTILPSVGLMIEF